MLGSIFFVGDPNSLESEIEHNGKLVILNEFSKKNFCYVRTNKYQDCILPLLGAAAFIGMDGV